MRDPSHREQIELQISFRGCGWVVVDGARRPADVVAIERRLGMNDTVAYHARDGARGRVAGRAKPPTVPAP